MARHPLRTHDDELRDLAEGSPLLMEASHGGATGARFLRLLGNGGMATVFLAELDRARRSADLHPETPARLALKVMQLSTQRALHRFGVDPLKFFSRETVALSRVMERTPPTEFVVACYGSGLVEVEVGDGHPRRLPWLAIEYVDGGNSGVSVTDRVARVADGIDPVRALRLLSGIVEGTRVLHEEGVIHRDLKPDNVLVAGPVDDETPKLADCGIARVAGLTTNMQAATPEYCGPEQNLSILGNPLVGQWTDVHALAAVAWFILGGEHWCSGAGDLAWHQGARRSLRSAPKLHRGFGSSESLVSELDRVLRAGAAQRPPEIAWATPEARAHEGRAMALFPGMFTGPPRFASALELADALLPLLSDAAARSRAQAGREHRAVSTFRPAHPLGGAPLGASAPLAIVHEHAASEIVGTETPARDALGAPMTPGCVVFQPDGKVLARVGSRLLYFVQGVPHKVRVHPDTQPLVDATRWITRGPAAGFALVGPRHVLLVRGGQMSSMPLPGQGAGSGTAAGPISAVIGDGRVFGVVTEATEDSGGPELWLSGDGEAWTGPEALPLGGSARAIAYGPFGFLVVGALGRRGRALFLGLDGQVVVYTKEVQPRSPLLVAVCGVDREAWGAGEGYVLRFDRGVASPEPIESTAAPAALALDPVGVPWLVTERAVLRRHVDSGMARWRTYYARSGDGPPLLAIGFTPDGARVLDGSGGTVHLTPHDIDAWCASADTALFLQARP